MRLDRRQFLQFGSVGLAGVCLTSCRCWGGPREGEIRVHFRGLCLFERSNGHLVVDIVDAAKVSLAKHTPKLTVRRSALNVAHTSRPTRIVYQGTSRETWEWNLENKTVSMLDQSCDGAPLEYDTSEIAGPTPNDADAMTSTRWVPDLKLLCARNSVTQTDVFHSRIFLEHGRVEGCDPTMHAWRHIVWTFRKPDGSQIAQQAFTDRVLYRCPLNGQKPVIRIGSDEVTLGPDGSDLVSIENLPDQSHEGTEGPSTDQSYSLGHFGAYYDLIGMDQASRPNCDPDPPSQAACSSCDLGPIFCPPVLL